MNNYGKELIIDMERCDSSLFTREHITTFFIRLCDAIDMQRCDLHFWDDLETPDDEKETEPHLVGTSAIQFIKTSNITIHTLDILKKVYLNIFSCKDFDEFKVFCIALTFFKGRVSQHKIIERL